ncbi:BrnT family toxin [Stagnihabitans tardus]|uniref:BrnT family toxin n=1 Tax=Stagnihabitans tardus TaxID=2699202 RepID=A0AAE4Y6L3_9RHOB|nr:BrnT family toxin [Stagnihabitans tardus]NBZ86806.1 BrnT family toxin [Stagnihabitans tardus]
MFEWDETKRLKALEKHGIDFRDAAEIFLGPYLEVAARSEVEERRYAIAPLGGRIICVVFTMRGDTIRIITARAARTNEREHYQALYDRGDPQG